MTAMTWEGERGGFNFRLLVCLSLFDIEKLIKVVGWVVRWGGEGKKIYRCGPGMDFFKSLIDHCISLVWYGMVEVCEGAPVQWP